MNRVLAILASCFLDLFGFIVAALAASAFMLFILFAQPDFSPGEMPRAVFAALSALWLVAWIVAALSALPALFVIVLGEFLSRRDWLFYALGGAFAGIANVVVLEIFGQDKSRHLDMGIIATLVASGIAGGLAYWLVAGQFAGAWRVRPLPRG